MMLTQEMMISKISDYHKEKGKYPTATQLTQFVGAKDLSGALHNAFRKGLVKRMGSPFIWAGLEAEGKDWLTKMITKKKPTKKKKPQEAKEISKSSEEVTTSNLAGYFLVKELEAHRRNLADRLEFLDALLAKGIQNV